MFEKLKRWALSRRLRKALEVKMTPEQEREQRISFAYGNAHLSNEHVTREMVEEVDDGSREGPQ